MAAALSPGEMKTKPGQCFAGAERFDVLWNGTKVAGAAQRRNRFGLLIQGSVQNGRLPADRNDWLIEMLRTSPWPERIQWKGFTLGVPLDLDEEITRRVQKLAVEKYSQGAYNQRR
jgi:lipoate-protein ligase A